MIVRYVRERGYTGEGKDPHATLGKTYIAFFVTFRPNSLEYPPLVCVLRDSDELPAMFELQLYDIVDDRVPEDWAFANTAKGWYVLSPQEFRGGFLDLFNDGDENAEKVFRRVREKLERFHGIRGPNSKPGRTSATH